MSSQNYDLIIVGGGLGGSALAKVMAEKGARVLLLEREQQYRDRVRGEVMFPWGVVELDKLGLYRTLAEQCGNEINQLHLYLGGACVDRRDTRLTNSFPTLNWVHHEMEEALLRIARDAGAEVRRGAHACGVRSSSRPAVTVDYQDRFEELTARLVVCADGRASLARKWGNFLVHQENYGMLLAGVLLDRMPGVSPEINYWFLDSNVGQFVFLSPQRDGMVRAYAWHPREWDYRYQREEDLPRFVEDSSSAGVPREWYDGARLAGPLATFDGADNWVDHPYNQGIALIGDAAAASDPSYGQGQSLTMRDVRVLRDLLLTLDDWDEAGHAYAAEHDHYYGELHKFTRWLYQIFYENGPAADERRARALPPMAQDLTRMPDVLVSGPDRPLDESVRRRFFGED
ncbi:MAG TPA: FAD-dependent monooxygenase [Candidatus Binataceae bacterium]|nr:FAD-dependent monooxygenase [Candidatus Binataceae bacterium]